MTPHSIAPKAVQLPNLLVILSGGGFTFETQLLLDHLRQHADFTYLRTPFGGTPGQHGLPPGPSFEVPSFATVTRSSVWTSLHAFTKTFFKTLGIVLTRRVDAIVGIGCSHTIPMLLAGRLTGRRNVFIETITRTTLLSNTGKIVYHLLLSDQFFVQWPDLQANYPRSSGGSLL